MKRLHNLDYLRGAAAFAIMIYHYITWSYGAISTETFLGRIGIYGVSVFYVLSGLTLYLVYYNSLTITLNKVVSFYKKRIYRIFPLLWLATILTLLVNTDKRDIVLILLNLSGLFGFVKWNSYIAIGAWSIGNELVFYSLFPAFIILSKYFKIWFGMLSVLIFMIYVYFAFFLISPHINLAGQWHIYINPLNQVFLFLGGFLLGLIFEKVKLGNIVSAALILLPLCAFIFYPSGNAPIALVSGVNRLVFTLFCLLICLGFYKLSIQFIKTINIPLVKLGELSYSIYLLHPLVYVVCKRFITGVYYDDMVHVLFSTILTIITSFIVYNYIEKRFVTMARAKYN